MRVKGSGFRVYGVGTPALMAVLGSVSESGCVPAWLRVQGSGFRVQGSGFRVKVSGFRFQVPGCRVKGEG